MNRRSLFSTLLACVGMGGCTLHTLVPSPTECNGFRLRWVGWRSEPQYLHIVGTWVATKPDIMIVLPVPGDHVTVVNPEYGPYAYDITCANYKAVYPWTPPHEKERLREEARKNLCTWIQAADPKILVPYYGRSFKLENQI